MMRSIVFGFLLTLAGCTTLGVHNPSLLAEMQARGDFGGPQKVRICGLLDEGISEVEAQELLDQAWNETEEKAFGLRFEIAKAVPWRRGAFMAREIIIDIFKSQSLESSCDRVFAFVDRNAGDVLHGIIATFLPIPATYGAAAFTHGYVVVRIGSLPQLLIAPPLQALKHELYHMVGCEHHAVDECYEQISKLKRTREGPDAFFPVVLKTADPDNDCKPFLSRLIASRETAKEIIRQWNETPDDRKKC